ncbi:MAG: LptF/LptG family permease [Bacteroidales bacterium]|nr:LptF/LptG family permease [Bacteroidales bacterium]
MRLPFNIKRWPWCVGQSPLVTPNALIFKKHLDESTMGKDTQSTLTTANDRISQAQSHNQHANNTAVKHRWLKLPLGKWLSYLGIKRLDRYIIGQFLGTYLFSIVLIITIAVVFDYNEQIDRFARSGAPMRKIILDYYVNFIPYFAYLFSSLFVFISVIFFTTKLAGNSEIIAMKAAGVSFRRLLRPYLLSAAVIAGASFYLGSFVIPSGTERMNNFRSTYIKRQAITTAENVMLQVEPGLVAHIEFFDITTKSGWGFSLDRFRDKQLIAHLTAERIQYDTLAAEPYRWKLSGYKIRDLKGQKEVISSGAQLDTLIKVEPSELFYTLNEQETLTLPELREFIDRQTMRGATNVINFELEYHRRFADPLAAFILTIIGFSLSNQKRKSGMGLSLGAGLALSFGYILFQRLSATLAIQSDWPAMLSVWLPNLLFTLIAGILYHRMAR